MVSRSAPLWSLPDLALRGQRLGLPIDLAHRRVWTRPAAQLARARARIERMPDSELGSEIHSKGSISRPFERSILRGAGVNSGDELATGSVVRDVKGQGGDFVSSRFGPISTLLQEEPRTLSPIGAKAYNFRRGVTLGMSGGVIMAGEAYGTGKPVPFRVSGTTKESSAACKARCYYGSRRRVNSSMTGLVRTSRAIRSTSS